MAMSSAGSAPPFAAALHGAGRLLRTSVLLAASVHATPLPAAQTDPPGTPSGLEEARGWASTPDGIRVRTILTRPRGADRPLPAVVFVQWLSCDPVEVPDAGGDGWAQTLRHIMQEAGVVFARTEKPGLGESGGPPCSELGFDAGLAAHRAALDELRRSPWVDPDSIYVFGASMGGTMAPLIAAGESGIRGVAVWGTTGVTWLEHMVALDRRVLELRGSPPADVSRWMPAHIRLQSRYLGDGADPRELVRTDADLAAAWSRVLGASEEGQYGRSFRYHQEAARADWPGAWAQVSTPVLVVYGEHDWIMPEAEHQRIASIVDPGRTGRAELVAVPGVDHNFQAFPSRAAAFASQGGRVDLGAAEAIVRWLGRLRRGHPTPTWATASFTEALRAPPPPDSAAAALSAFGRLVGAWDLEVTYHPEEGPAFTLPGEWHFSWVLDGRGVQDVWRVRDERQAIPTLRGLGTTLRVLDSASGSWHSVWVSALSSSVTLFEGREVDGEIHLVPQGPTQDPLYRWVFFDVTPGTFRWRAESSPDAGRTWRIEQQMRAWRR